MNVGLVGTGPAADAARAAFEDIDATVTTDADALSGTDLTVVVAPAGAEQFTRADDVCDRLVACEVGGVGGHALEGVDAAVSVFTPDSARFSDLSLRVASTVDDSDSRPTGDRSAVRFAGAVAGRRAVRLLAGEPIGGTVVEIPGAERRFLPVPDGSRDRTLDRSWRSVPLDDALDRAERAMDDRVGLLTQVGERESFPIPYYLAGTADTTTYSDARAAAFAAGADPDWDRAFMKALGEGLERYCAGVYRYSEFVVAPETNRARPVSPARFARPDGYRQVDREERIAWVEGEHLATGEQVSLPAEFVHYPPPDERHKPAITTGLGLGNSGAEALLSGLYEVVERDATMLAWYSTFDPLGLDVDDDRFETLVKRARAEELDVTPLLVTQDVDVPVVAVAVHRDPERESDEAWPRFAMGSGADLDPVAAARSALAEALQNWMELRSMGPERAADEKAAIGDYAEFPSHARRFVECDATVPAASVGPDPLPEGEAELAAAVDRVTDAGLDAYAARTTTRDVAELGFEAVRVLIPEAQPLFTGEPFFTERAETVPEELGFEPRLDREYHPYP
ncbi:bacteriocin biosynthesis protein SagD [Salinigranum rubrum]|uniref:Bacteriocin biosynthesis protein SagD n=1 Tax=Salinigranum rubrum TaxID=755307 RepID=A0A2I8VKD9_9EURY|nr:YcaO-like family protein [Salinigranum rubrum]AUV82388.1 bacteriocin biosynthesis protein SagD [Salinigranum rubrum]